MIKLIKFLFGSNAALIYGVLKFVSKLYNIIKIIYMSEGLIPKEQMKLAAGTLDSLFDFNKIAETKSGIFKYILKGLELADGKGFLAGLEYFDNKHAEKLPQRFRLVYVDFINGLADKNVTAIQAAGGELINIFVNLPELNEAEEAELIGHNLAAIIKIVRRKLLT